MRDLFTFILVESDFYGEVIAHCETKNRYFYLGITNVMTRLKYHMSFTTGYHYSIPN